MLHRIPSPNRRLLAALAVAVLAAGARPVLAQDAAVAADVAADIAADGPDIPGMAAPAADDDGDVDLQPGFPERLARRLDLTDAQRDAIAKIHEAGRARDLPLRKQARLVRHELQGEMMKDAPAEKTVLALARQANDLRGQLQAGRLLDRLAVRKVLTEEQRDKLMAIGDRRGGFGPGGFGPGGFGPGGFGPGRGGPGAAFMRGEGRHGRDGEAWGGRDGGRRLRQHQSDQKTE